MATRAGSGASGDSLDRSSSHAKNRTSAPPLPGPAVAHRSAQHRIALLDGVEHDPLGDRPVDLDPHLPVDVGQLPQVHGQHHPDHGNTWTSTDSTAGRSRTIGVHVSPESADPYT